MNDHTSGWQPAKTHDHHLVTASSSDDEIDLGELFALFWRRKFTLIIAMLLAMILGAAYVSTQPNLYEAEATLILDEQEQNATGLEALAPGLSNEDAEMNSQIQVIKSRKLMGIVVDELSLTEDPEYVSSLRPPSLIGRSIKWVRSKLSANEPGARQVDVRDQAIDQLTKNLSATVLPKTHVFKIRIETEDADKSVNIVNAVAAAFVDDQIVEKKESTENAAKWLNGKVAELQISLNQAEAEAAAFRSQTERVVTEQELVQSNQKLKIARGRYDSFILSLERTTGSTVPSADRDVIRNDALLKEIRTLEAIVEKQTNDLLTIRQLDREAETEGQIYQHFATRLNEIEVQKGLHESDVRILSAAVPRPQPVKPRKPLTIAIFGILGLILSAAYILIRKFMDRSFKTAEELENAFRLPVLGMIPTAPHTNRRKLLNYALKRPSSGIVESIRGLRTSLLSNKEKTEPSKSGDVYLFTSSVPAEGKTTSSVLLSVNSASLDKKVLLVECDLRRSTFKTYFGPQTKFGLLDAINGKIDIDQIIYKEERANIDVIFGGQSSGENAGDIFASEKFGKFIETMRNKYDLIILDSPPVLPVPDARLISNHCDKIIYAVKSNSTPSSVVSAGIRLFEGVNRRIDGFIFTQMKNKGGYGYGSEYYRN
jgi:capsular exopolysaccharide synthesis family protein